MSEPTACVPSIMTVDADLWADLPKHGFWRRTWFWLRFWVYVKTARLRFIAVLVAIGAVIAYWETLILWYERWTRPADTTIAAASNVECFCPFHPQIVRGHSKDKCPICFMRLSRRTRGARTEFPRRAAKL